jgi:hypothetical protein
MRVYKGYEGYKGDDLPKDMTWVLSLCSHLDNNMIYKYINHNSYATLKLATKLFI